MRIKPLITVIFCSLGLHSMAQETYHITSPDGRLDVSFTVKGEAHYSIQSGKQQVLLSSRLGLVRGDGDFSQNLSVVSAGTPSIVTDSYQLLTIKRRINHYKANKRIFHLKNSNGQLIDIIFQVSNDGVAFRYFFPGKPGATKTISNELTSFHFSTDTRAWLQPKSEAKSGWSKANPSYEEFYQKDIAVGTPSPIKAGWVYPALFKSGNTWVLLSETFPTNGDFCNSNLKAESPDGEYSVAYPDPREVIPGGAASPEGKLPWYTPWRIIAIGSLQTITASTLGTDVAAPSLKAPAGLVKPGKASWSWVLLKDDKTVYDVQHEFIDYAADMHWQYCLIDDLWDTQIGYEKIQQLITYARSKGVGILLWYNSAGSWNETPQTPRNKMLTHESRVKEFGRLKAMGVKGVKIDFFGGDGQSFVKYYVDILKDALDFGLLVNFHGTTLPRGLERRFPNLMTMEAIRGMEFATFEQSNLDEQPEHCTTIPFTRNVFDPMDYTPMALYRVPNLKRRTTSAFELALPVVFQSGIQHLAETPEGMSHMPDYVKQFLQNLPNSWDDVRLIDGYPGKLAVLARRSGNKWFIAGINGEKTDKTLSLDLSFLNGKPAQIISDGAEPVTFTNNTISTSGATQVNIKAYGGFVMVIK